VLRDPYVLIVPADSELAARDSAPPLRELSGVPLIGWRSTAATRRPICAAGCPT
jgi:LysR substrate binding domain.